MLRLMFQLLGLLALLLAPLPAAAAPPQPAAVASGAEHCSETDASASHEDQDRSQEDEAKHPCCESGLNCCPVAAGYAGPALPRLGDAASPAHHPLASAFLLGAANPPLTEPPTLA